MSKRKLHMFCFLLLLLTVVTANSQSLEFVMNSSCVSSPDTLNGMRIQMIVDDPPVYIGGSAEFYKDLLKVLKYPQNLQLEIDTKFYFALTIDTLGTLNNICLIKPEGKSIIDLSKMDSINRWTPGKHEGINVPVRILVPLIIELQE